jgi:type II secretory pathway pseudopilin PulG
VKDKKSARQGRACRSTAFTLVEILAALGIIAILVALLIPALTTVRKMAKETQQKAQITTIELGLTAFKNDYGDYPPSNGSPNPSPYYYCGAQTLAEALVGWDMMGFHPKSIWDSDGTAYEPPTPDKDNLKARKGSYLELATANVFKLGDLFTDISSFKSYNFVICDVFGVKSVTIGKKTVKAGAPILYYKANTSSKTIDSTESDPKKKIYNYMDNIYFVRDVKEGVNPLASGTSGSFFYEYIRDPKVSTTTIKWPSRPDSYILISAGADGLYGTRDDICNFDPNS